MKIVEISHPLREMDFAPCVAAIGHFDGLHKGHQEVIRRAIQKSKSVNVPSCVITFYPYPKEILAPKDCPAYLTSLPDKLEILQSLGVDSVYIIHFTKEFSQLTPQEFVEQILFRLNVVHIVAGFDFRFGKGGQGNACELKKLGDQRFSVEIVESVNDGEQKISSSLIRSLIQGGKIEEANQYLTRPYRLRGIVIPGEKRGRMLGFPTANIKVLARYQFPKTGVYGVNVTFQSSRYNGVMNIGYKPTFHSTNREPSIEVHLFDFEGDLYQQEIMIEVLFYIREEKKFDHIQALIEQINRDIQFAKEKFLCYTM